MRQFNGCYRNLAPPTKSKAKPPERTGRLQARPRKRAKAQLGHPVGASASIEVIAESMGKWRVTVMEAAK